MLLTTFKIGGFLRSFLLTSFNTKATKNTERWVHDELGLTLIMCTWRYTALSIIIRRQVSLRSYAHIWYLGKIRVRLGVPPPQTENTPTSIWSGNQRHTWSPVLPLKNLNGNRKNHIIILLEADPRIYYFFRIYFFHQITSEDKCVGGGGGEGRTILCILFHICILKRIILAGKNFPWYNFNVFSNCYASASSGYYEVILKNLCLICIINGKKKFKQTVLTHSYFAVCKLYIFSHVYRVVRM